jgi:hypothetical protein
MDLRFSICCFKNHLVDDLVNISEQLYIDSRIVNRRGMLIEWG